MVSDEENSAHQSSIDSLSSLVALRTEQLKQSVRNLERCYDITLESLGDALALKHLATQQHSKRVAAYSIGIARAAGMPRDQIAVLARGAFLHDIGKIGVHDSILQKPSALTPDETTSMREHCLLGYKMVKKIPFLAEAAEIIYSHHEWYDGTGYPRGLKGEEIPLGARLVAVANALDSIMSDLPDHPAQSYGAAREEIRHWAGRQFDPVVVNTLVSTPDKIWNDLRIEIEAQTASNPTSASLPKLRLVRSNVGRD
jgi:putative nucleotidyltransferase with HDIG domain